MHLTNIRRSGVRFAFSPLQEALRALHVLVDAHRHAPQMDWVRRTRRRLTPELRSGLKRFSPLLRSSVDTFPGLLPLHGESDFTRDLHALARAHGAFRETMLRRIIGKPLLRKEELELAARPRALAKLARDASRHDVRALSLFAEFLKSERAIHDAFCAFVDAFFARCFTGDWTEFDARARADIRAREQLLERFGVAAMLRTLSRDFSVAGTAARAALSYVPPALAALGANERPTIDCANDTEVRLTPSYFTWPHPTLAVLRAARTVASIAYPLASPTAVRATRTWERTAEHFSALSDPTRLRMLELLTQRDLSTREFAGLLGLSEAGVSRHLAILRRAHLVTSVRDGYFVLYRRAHEGMDTLAEMIARI